MFFRLLPLAFLVSCLDQFDPRAFWEQIGEEERLANAEPLLLSDDGSLPFAFDEAGVPQEAGEIDANQLFASYCASCHGAQGQADGPASASLTPQPRNLADATWQRTYDDDHIRAVIQSGGTAVGLSSAMPPWGAVLNEDQVDALVAHVRSFSP